MATVLCAVTSASDTLIVCTLENTPLAGEWDVEVRSQDGLVPSNASPISQSLTVTSVSPNADINFLGGDVLTIAGIGFGSESEYISVTF